MNTKTLLVIFAVLLLLLTLLSAFGGSIRPTETFYEEPTMPMVSIPIPSESSDVNPPSVTNNPLFQDTSSSNVEMMADRKEQFYIEPFEEEKLNESNFAPF
jgi:hypothetical protein